MGWVLGWVDACVAGPVAGAAASDGEVAGLAGSDGLVSAVAAFGSASATLKIPMFLIRPRPFRSRASLAWPSLWEVRVGKWAPLTKSNGQLWAAFRKSGLNIA